MKPEHEQLLTRLISEHPYLSREVKRYSLHGAIEKMQVLHGIEPENMEKLLLEWPHVSKDEARIAYTQSPLHGEADRQTVTTLGRYLTKCFPTAKSDVIRDIAALYQVSGCSFTERTTMAFVYAVQNGPNSCMKWQGYTDLDSHPYQVYDPKYGWHMAINRMGEEIWGRCLCLDDGENKYYVRSYHQPSSGQGYSHSDTVLEAWLRDQGYQPLSSWPTGTKVALIKRGVDDFLMPYFDGELKLVSMHEDHFSIERHGNWTAWSTDGYTEQAEFCNSCDEATSETTSVGYGGNYGSVCERCLERHYCYAIGRHGESYFISLGDAVVVGDESYDTDYLDENNIVLITSGAFEDTYAHREDTVSDIHDEVWHNEDADLVLLQHGVHEGGFISRHETWICEGSGFSYCADDEFKEINGKKFHVDFDTSTQICEVSHDVE